MKSKECSKCKTVKALDEFPNRKDAKDGKRSECKVCVVEYNRTYNEIHKLALTAYRKDYKEVHKVKIAAYQKEYREVNKLELAAYKKEYSVRYCAENKESIAKRSSAYSKNNPEKMNAHTAKHRAKKLQAVPVWDINNEETKLFLQSIYRLSSSFTKLHQTVFNVDHIIPLQSDLVCGLHTPANLRIITASENSSKGNRRWVDMW